MKSRILPEPEARWSRSTFAARTHLPVQPDVPPIDPPPDLREWVEPGVLLVWLEEEVKQAGLGLGAGPLRPQGPKEFPAQKLLAVLSLAYAIAVFDNREIIRHCRSDVSFRLLCEGELPFAHELTAFRRKKRAVIARVLANLFLRALRESSLRDGNTPGPAAVEHLLDCAVIRVDIARHLDNWQD